MDRHYRPPRRPWRELADSIEQFRASYNIGEGCKDYYDRVWVIHVTWDKDALPDFIPTQEAQSRELEKTFRELYNYQTKRVVLPHHAEETAYDMLAAAIQHDTTRLTKHDLLILHYQGHGEYTIRNKFDSHNQEDEWQFSQRLAASFLKFSEGKSEATQEWARLDFTKLRETYIDNAAPHVLMLMDCCHAAAVACGPMSGKELLAATAVGDRHQDSGKGSWGECSFTNNVNHILRHAFDTGNIMPTSELYARLYTNYWIRKDIGEGTRKLEAEPVHMLLHEGLQTPIIIAPLRQVVSRYQPPLDFLFDTRLPTVRVDCYTSDDNLDAEDLRRYLRDHQGLSGRITVNNVYRVGSYVVELEMSVSTWYRISHHPNLHFRYVKGPEKLNPPDFSFPIHSEEHPNLLTIRPRIGPEASGEPSKPRSPAKGGSETPDLKENRPWS